MPGIHQIPLYLEKSKHIFVDTSVYAMPYFGSYTIFQILEVVLHLSTIAVTMGRVGGHGIREEGLVARALPCCLLGGMSLAALRKGAR